MAPAGLLIGYLSSDLLSGLVHWFCDNFFLEDSPIIGPLLIYPFREHHRDPAAMTRHGFLELTGNSCLGLIPLLAFGLWQRERLPPLSEIALLALCVSLFATNLFHKWAHAPVAPAPVRWLQRRSLILNPAHHRQHHRAGFSAAYCITTGWMNRSLDFILRVCR